MTEENTKPKNYVSLAEKIAKANKDIGAIAKDGNNNYQRYSFQSEAAIKAAVQRVISDNKFSIIPNFKVIDKEQQKTQKGGINNFVYVQGTFTITDGVETLIGAMPGAGSDTGEKAVQKACTSAHNYLTLPTRMRIQTHRIVIQMADTLKAISRTDLVSKI